MCNTVHVSLIQYLKMSKPVTLSKQLLVSVIEMINVYSEKGIFKIKEYKDVSEIDERLRAILVAVNANAPFQELTVEELQLVVSIFKEGSQRMPTAVESFGHIYAMYQAFQSMLEQKLVEQKEQAEVPSVEELNN